MAAACAFGVFRCQCDRFRRLVERRPQLDQERPWHWEERNGCERDAPEPVKYWKGKALYRCPSKLVDPQWWEYLVLFQHWQKGRPIVATAVLDEPARLLDIMHILQDEHADIQKERRERMPGAPRSPGVVIGGQRAGLMDSPHAPQPSTGPLSGRARKRGR